MTKTTLTRMRDRAVTDRAELDRLLDDTFLAHVGMTDGSGGAVVIPTAIARDGDRILVHGSTGSGWMRRAAGGSPVCVAVTELSGIIVARSSFESSFRYRSAVLFGTFTRLSGPDVPRALDVITERFLPGRLAEIRGTRRRERAATMGAQHADPRLVDEDLGRLAHRSRRRRRGRRLGRHRPLPRPGRRPAARP